MAPPEGYEVTDPADPRVADYIGLTDVALRSRAEVEHGVFLAEGELVVRRALAAGLRPRSVLLAEDRARLQPELLDVAGSDVPTYVAAHAVLEALTGFHVHRGVLASFHRPAPLDPGAVLAAAERVLVLDDVNNHTNVGAVLRCAAGLGMDAVLLTPRSADPLYRRAVRVSMGQVFALPWARLPELLQGGLDLLRDSGFRVLALAVDGAVALPDVAVDGRVALLLGAEGGGLPREVQAAVDARVRIPMAAGVDSLNVAMAAAVACWALGRRPG